ncbi:MAG: carbohydrate kinase [Clostridiaceae bacterium]|jgi:L-xylulokinase|nr:carbohydrate kinase [Clostridiaceae bacterium]
MRYYLGLDNGGTTTKAALYDEKGNEKGFASVDTRMLTPRPGFTERDMDEMWEANCAVIREVLKKTGIKGSQIRAIAICGHGKGLYLWGKDDRPVRNGIISTDNRAWEYPIKWRQDGTEKKAFEMTCQHVLACQPVALLAWLKDHEPEIMDSIKYVFACKDYVRFRLTGEAWAEMTDYSGTSLMNLHTRQYDPRILELFGLSELMDALPPLRLSTDICGTVTAEAARKTGLLEGTPVAGGMFDIDACALAAHVADEDHVCMIAGTWSINEFIRRTPVLDGTVMMNSLFCIPEYYLIEECSPTSAGNNEWFLKTLMPEFIREEKLAGRVPYREIDRMVESIPPTEFCPVFLPFLMASNVHPNAKGSFVGMSSYHTRSHLLRSVYEGIAFSHRQHYDKLEKCMEREPKSIRLAGGAARSRVWTQIFADVMKCPVETVAVRETGALGSAIAAAVAVGDYADIKDALRAMSRLAPAVMPNTGNFESYDKKYDLYRQTIDALDPVWDSYQALMG